MSLNITANHPVKIINQAGNKPWAKTIEQITPEPFSALFFDTTLLAEYQRWRIAPFGDEHTIRNVGSQFFAYGEGPDDAVTTSRQLSFEHCRWSIESAGDGKWKIKKPNQDLVWTVRDSQPARVVLAPADGSEEQNFSFEVDVRADEAA